MNPKPPMVWQDIAWGAAMGAVSMNFLWWAMLLLARQ